MAKASIKKVQTELIEREDVTLIYEGQRTRRGRKTSEKCVVVGVVKKEKDKKKIPKSQLIPRDFKGHKTDIIETGEIVAQRLVTRERPCPPGYSVGHPDITAGTLGFYYQGADEKWYFVSNNHVIANSNDAVEGDLLIQPGDADGGSQPGDNFARLYKEVEMNFGNNTGGGGKKSPKAAFWAVSRGIPNTIARMFRCDYRLPKPVRPMSVTQPNPNLVDLSVAEVLNPKNVDTKIPFIGEIQGVYDAQIGDWVQKTGRTTEHTTGDIDGIGMASVSYGPGKGVANFEDQLIIAPNGRHSQFSAGGDSGSAILDEDNFLVGLLFAGGDGVTIANRITNVIRIGNIPL